MEWFRGGPLDVEQVARRKSSLDELSFVDDELWHVQSQPQLGGPKQLMRCRVGEKPTAVSPPEIEVGSWLHAYGGGSYAVGDHGVWIVNEADSSVWLLDPATGGHQRATAPGDGYVYGHLSPSPGGVLAVRENAERGDQIVEITRDGRLRVLVETPGFLADPRVSEDQLAYLAWDSGEMPWDATRLCLTSYEVPGDRTGVRLVAGGPDESITEPAWGADGRLYFLSDRTGWWNLYSVGLEGLHRVLAVDQDCCPAPWEGGYRSYAFLPDGSIAVSIHDGFQVRLLRVDAHGQATPVRTDLKSVKPCLAAAGSRLAVIGSSASHAPSVQVIGLEMVDPAAASDDSSFDNGSGYVPSEASVGEVSCGDRPVRFLLRNSKSASANVPLLLRAHPGPTDNVPFRLDWSAEFFVSRGFAVADVAYRGSSGMGRDYRQALHGRWGQYDVEDCLAVARHLLATGVARAGAVFISGASAGGYTALQAARVPGPFTAATARSAIIDPQAWATTAPRFQRAHAAILAGPAGRVVASEISVPVLLIHGSDDPVVPIEDARSLAQELTKAGKPHEALFLDGGGHYLSDPRSLRAALSAEADFYNGLIEAGVGRTPGQPMEAPYERTR